MLALASWSGRRHSFTAAGCFSILSRPIRPWPAHGIALGPGWLARSVYGGAVDQRNDDLPLVVLRRRYAVQGRRHRSHRRLAAEAGRFRRRQRDRAVGRQRPGRFEPAVGRRLHRRRPRLPRCPGRWPRGPAPGRRAGHEPPGRLQRLAKWPHAQPCHAAVSRCARGAAAAGRAVEDHARRRADAPRLCPPLDLPHVPRRGAGAGHRDRQPPRQGRLRHLPIGARRRRSSRGLPKSLPISASSTSATASVPATTSSIATAWARA